MAEMLNVNPTRGILLQLQDQLKDIQTRHNLLDRKREVLIQELMSRMEEKEKLEEQSTDLFQKAHKAMQRARMRMGSNRIECISLSPTAHLEVSTKSRTIMGLRVPSVDIEVEPINPPYGLGDTSAALDEARECWLEVVRFIAESSETMTAVWRLAMEVRKTQRQVNALESTIIPRYKRTIRFIESRLEEEEREDIVQAKKVKERQNGRSIQE